MDTDNNTNGDLQPTGAQTDGLAEEISFANQLGDVQKKEDVKNYKGWDYQTVSSLKQVCDLSPQNLHKRRSSYKDVQEKFEESNINANNLEEFYTIPPIQQVGMNKSNSSGVVTVKQDGEEQVSQIHDNNNTIGLEDLQISPFEFNTMQTHHTQKNQNYNKVDAANKEEEEDVKQNVQILLRNNSHNSTEMEYTPRSQYGIYDHYQNENNNSQIEIGRRDSMLTRTVSQELPGRPCTPRQITASTPASSQAQLFRKSQMGQKEKQENSRSALSVSVIAVTNVLKNLIPPETRLCMQSKWKKILLEILVGLILIAGLVLIYLYFSICGEVTVISSQQQGRECKPLLIAKRDSFIIDSYGNWRSTDSFIPQSAYFQLHLYGYENTDQGFYQNITYIKNQTNELVDQLQSLPWIQVLQGILYSDISVEGRRGVMKIEPYFDVLSLFHQFSSFTDSFYNLEEFIPLPNDTSGLAPFQIPNSVSLEVQENSCGFNSWRRYNEKDLGSRWTASRYEYFGISPEFAVYVPANLNGSIVYPNQQCRNCDNCNSVLLSGEQQLQMQIRKLMEAREKNQTRVRSDLFDPRGVFDWIPGMLIEDDGIDSIYLQMAELRWDMYQVIGIDFCNRNIQYCNNLYGTGTTKELLLPYTTSKYPLIWIQISNTKGAYGYYWRSNENPWGYLEHYVVVPQFSELDGCSGCQALCDQCDTRMEIECQFVSKCKLQLQMYLNFYLIKNPEEFGNIPFQGFQAVQADDVKYVASYSFRAETTGFMNEFLAELDVNCCSDRLKFLDIAFEAQDVPFSTGTGFFSCKVDQCKEFLERVADAFATSELAFAGITVVLVTLSMLGIWLLFGETNPSAPKKYERDLSGGASQSQTFHQKVVKGLWVVRKSAVDYFDFMLPQEGKKAISRFIRLFLGVLFFVGLLVAFFLQYFAFDRCTQNFVVSTVDQTSSTSTCTERKLMVWEQIVLDGNGRFETDPRFDPRKAYWILELFNYSSNDDGFKQDMKNVSAMLNLHLESLSDDDQIVATEKLLFQTVELYKNNFSKISLKPNLDLYPLNLAGYDTFYNLQPEIQNGSLIDRVRAVQEFCSDAWYPAQGNAHYVNQGPLNMFRFIYRDSMKNGSTSTRASGECQTNIFSADTPDKPPFTFYPAMLRSSGALRGVQEFRIGLEAKQVYQIDFRNRMWDEFGEGCGDGGFDFFTGDEIFQVGCSTKLQKWGFIGSTQQNIYAPLVWYFIVPELSPIMSCMDCNTSRDFADTCNRWHIIQLHYYYVYDIHQSDLFFGILPETYIGTYGSIQITSSTWNREFSSFGKLFCGAKELFLPEDIENILEVPFELTTELYECEIIMCNSIWERAAESFANTEFLFVFFFHLILLIFVCVASMQGVDPEVTKENKLDYAIYFSDFSGSKQQQLQQQQQQQQAESGRRLTKYFSSIKQREEDKNTTSSGNGVKRGGQFWRVLQIPARVAQIPVPLVAYETCGPVFRAIIGVIIACVLLIVFFIFFFAVYSQCKEYEAITTDKSASVDCRNRAIRVSDDFVLDKFGNWDVNQNYNIQKGFWKVKLNDYRNDMDGFYSNLNTLQNYMQANLTALQGKNYIDVIQDLLFTDHVIGGQNGTMQLLANMDISFLFAPVVLNYVHSFYNFENIINNQTAMLSAIKTCDNLMVRVYQSKTRVTGKYLFITFSEGYLSTSNYMYAWPDGTCNNSVSLQRVASSENAQKYFQQIYLWSSASTDTIATSSNSRNNRPLNYWDIVVDLNQAFFIDYCNKNLEKCKKRLDQEFPECYSGAEDVELNLHTGLRQTAVFRPSLCKFGYTYNVTGNLYVRTLPTSQLSYFVDPQFLQQEGCQNSCNGGILEELCGHQRVYELFLHHYTNYEIPEISNYNSTIYIGIRTNGGWNSENTFGRVYCNTDELFIDANLSQINIPYDVLLDLFECQIRECKSLAEKLATSFANVENLFILITLFLFLTLTCFLNWRSSSDHVQIQFYSYFN